MARGIIGGVTANGYIVSAMEWSATPNNEGNYSDVVATLRYSRTNSGHETSGTWSGGIIIDGTTFTGTAYLSITQNSNTFTMSASKRVYHNSDGKKQITISAYGTIANTTLKSTTLSGVVTLDSIPRAAMIVMASDFNDEEEFVNLLYSNPAGNYVDSIQACLSLDKVEMVIPYRDIEVDGEMCRFELGEREKEILYLATLNGSNDRIVYYGLKTVIDGVTYEEWSPKKFSVLNAKPTIEAYAMKDADDTNNYFGDLLIQSYGDVWYEMNAYAHKGASIVSQKVTCGAISSTELCGTLSDVETGEVVFTAIDNRGNEETKTINLKILPYGKLTCNLVVDGPDGNGTMNLGISGKISSLEHLNNVTVYVRYKTSGFEYGDWIDGVVQEVDFGQGRYVASATIENLDYTKKYFVQAKAVDLVDEKESAEIPAIAIPVFDWSENDFNFNVPVIVQGRKLVNPYPVGSIWMTVTDDNPKDLFGGKWEKIKDRFLLGSSDEYGSYYVGMTGGNSIINYEHLPVGTVINEDAIGSAPDKFAWVGGTNSDGDLYYKYTEGEQPEYLPPYYVVNIWKRVE